MGGCPHEALAIWAVRALDVEAARQLGSKSTAEERAKLVTIMLKKGSSHQLSKAFVAVLNREMSGQELKGF